MTPEDIQLYVMTLEDSSEALVGTISPTEISIDTESHGTKRQYEFVNFDIRDSNQFYLANDKTLYYKVSRIPIKDSDWERIRKL